MVAEGKGFRMCHPSSRLWVDRHRRCRLLLVRDTVGGGVGEGGRGGSWDATGCNERFTEGLGADRRSRTRTTMSGFFNFRKTVRCRVRFRFMRRLYNLSSLAISILQTPVAQSNQVAINENDASMLFSVKCL